MLMHLLPWVLVLTRRLIGVRLVTACSYAIDQCSPNSPRRVLMNAIAVSPHSPPRREGSCGGHRSPHFLFSNAYRQGTAYEPANGCLAR